jgi:hypothetical protein
VYNPIIVYWCPLLYPNGTSLGLDDEPSVNKDTNAKTLLILDEVIKGQEIKINPANINKNTSNN